MNIERTVPSDNHRKLGSLFNVYPKNSNPWPSGHGFLINDDVTVSRAASYLGFYPRSYGSMEEMEEIWQNPHQCSDPAGVFT